VPQGVGVRLPERPLTVESNRGCKAEKVTGEGLRYEVITSPSNPRLRSAILLREPKYRKREGRVLIDSATSIDRALHAGIVCEEIFVRLSWLEGLEAQGVEQLQSWLERCPSARVLAVGPGAFAKLQYGQRDEDAIASAVPPDISLTTGSQRIRSSERELFLVLDRMEKPGNLGAMLRSADAAGVAAVLVSDPICEIWNPNAIRSSLGAIFSVPLIVGSQSELQSWLRARNAELFAARTERGVDYASVMYPARTAIVIGNEAQGLGDRWSEGGIANISIPMLGTTDSLNASVCSAILLFEVARQVRSP
jgi:TrmH family RNA methyltransferase